ncbi:MAG: DUF4175 family protein, partial [Alphaproteobacteria bacterium]
MTDFPERDAAPSGLRGPLRLTLAGLWAERLAQAFWPFASALALAIAALRFGLVSLLPDGAARLLFGALALAVLAGLVVGLLRLRPPRRAEALARLDARLPGQPIAALTDSLALGAGDPAAEALWQAHRARMAERLRAARPVPPEPDLPRRDPFALRLSAATALAASLLFGGGTPPEDLAALVPGGAPSALAEASWEGWIEPPAYTGAPTLYLPDLPAGALSVPVGARVTLRLYGKPEAIEIRHAYAEDRSDDGTTRRFRLTGDGTLSIGRRAWEIAVVPDRAPQIEPTGGLTRTLEGEMRLPFRARDDYGVVSGAATIGLDLAGVARRHGLAPDPDP